MSLVKDPDNIKLAMLGMVRGNGHPYSWSAIINGEYNKEAMQAGSYPVIYEYLSKEPQENLGIKGASVTHIWTDDPKDAQKVAQASCIPNIVEQAEDVIDKVDAVIIATDIGSEHVDRARPFIERNIPVFIDKPLTDNADDLDQFSQWISEGKVILSSSAMFFAKEIIPYHGQTDEFGELRFITYSMIKKWETYGIHAVAAVYPILGPGFISVRNIGTYERNIVHCQHKSGCDVIITQAADMFGSSNRLHILGTEKAVCLKNTDTFTAFKAQLQAFISYLQTGKRPFPYEQTREQINIVIAGIQSREKGGQKILLNPEV